MGDRRMFSTKITSTGKFLKLPATARLLYYDLGMNTDDDGVVEAYTVLELTKAKEKDLKILESKGYVKILNDDLVTYIIDWNINNSIRADRYHAGIYRDLLVGFDNHLTTKCQPSDNQMTTKCQPNGNQMATEVKLSKDKLSKGNYISTYSDYQKKKTGNKFNNFNERNIDFETLEKEALNNG